MHNSILSVQRTLLESFLNSHLVNLLGEEALDGTEINGQNGQQGCIEILDKLFSRFYPAFVQRAEFWAMRQKPGQRFSEALALCRRLGDQCDVLGMTPDEIMCTRIITLCTDDELCSEPMNPEEPPVAKLTQIVQEYERSQTGKAGLGGGHEGAHALAASSGARSKTRKKAEKWEGQVQIMWMWA